MTAQIFTLRIHSTPPSTRPTPHNTFYTQQSTLNFTLHTPHHTPFSTHHTSQSAIYSAHSPLLFHTLHSNSTLYIVHSTLSTPHFTSYTPRFTLHTPHTLHSTLCTHSTLHMFHSSHSTLHSLQLHVDSGRIRNTVVISCFAKSIYLMCIRVIRFQDKFKKRNNKPAPSPWSYIMFLFHFVV